MALRDIVMGILQLPASRTKSEALNSLRSMAGRVRAANIISMPEYAMVDPTDVPLETLREWAESPEEPGPWLREIERISAESGACVVATFFEPARDGRVYNTAAIVKPSGGIAGLYRKTHLFDAYGYRESEKVAPGDSLFQPLEACGAKIGLLICFELRVCELARIQALRGAELIVAPSAWYAGPLKEEALHTLAAARAHENTVYLVVPALAGHRFTGRSMIADPMGVRLVDAGPKPCYVEASLERWRLEEARRILPILRLLRGELLYNEYARLPDGRSTH